ncbi:hypothetical protein [Natronogracilivirga saccharolytica]|uniref:DUF883 domain-containing protein n=1 Tax=Natronogracilivirga saccharolytica TaxID=2812953 RepID=A0A8J7RLN7_9BACT|nr:hypothetical protein [Natronogracilivirga saccharolytica]MBP3193155.1 hypothetical protein [Natronogracilivirga saccharolytica]
MEEDKGNEQVKFDDLSKKFDSTYKDIIEKLNEEKDRLENELRQEYRSARKYVRSHPEEGLAYSFLGGLVAGVIIAKIFSRR